MIFIKIFHKEFIFINSCYKKRVKIEEKTHPSNNIIFESSHEMSIFLMVIENKNMIFKRENGSTFEDLK